MFVEFVVDFGVFVSVVDFGVLVIYVFVVGGGLLVIVGIFDRFMVVVVLNEMVLFDVRLIFLCRYVDLLGGVGLDVGD